MKTLKRIIGLTTVLVLVFTVTSCSLFEKKASYTQKIIASNLEITVRDDMTEDLSITSKGENYITCYLWEGYGMNVRSYPAERILLNGKTGDDLIAELLAGKKNLSQIKKFGDISYMEYTVTEDSQEYLFTAFIAEEGSEFYILEFYTAPEKAEKYMEQYQTIVSSIRMIRETKSIIEATIGGVTLKIDGDAVDKGNNIYSCSRYMVSCAVYDVPANYSTEEFCKLTIKQADYKTADGKTVTEINTTPDGISSFECIVNDLYSYHFARTEGTKLLYLYFFTKDQADEQLKTDLGLLAASAKLA